MKLQNLFIAGAMAIGLSGCVVVPATGTFTPTTAPGPSVNTAAPLALALSGRMISRYREQHVLLPDGTIDGRFFPASGPSYAVSGRWSVNGNNLCLTIESEPLCERAAIQGDQLLHWINGPGQADIWTISR